MSKFETVIPTSGPDGNIFSMLGNARRVMRQIGVKSDEIDALSKRVTEAQSYDDACAAIREWFPLEMDGDDR